MKVKELIKLLRMQVMIEFRIDNNSYCTCKSDSLMIEHLGECEVQDWFVFSDEYCICINLKAWNEVKI